MALRTKLELFGTLLWVGWRVDRWNEPFVLVSGFLKPISAILTVELIYLTGAQALGAFQPANLAYVVVGTAFFTFVVQIVSSGAFIIFDDRSNFQMFRNIYVSATRLGVYFIGRATLAVLISCFSVTISLVSAVLISPVAFGAQVPISFEVSVTGVLLVSTVVLIIFVLALALSIAGLNLVYPQVNFPLAELIPGAIFLFSGVAFPTALLPEPMAQISRFLPSTYYFQIVHEAFAGENTSIWTELGWEVVTTLIFTLFLVGLFRLAQDRAKRLGVIDRPHEF